MENCIPGSDVDSWVFTTHLRNDGGPRAVTLPLAPIVTFCGVGWLPLRPQLRSSWLQLSFQSLLLCRSIHMDFDKFPEGGTALYLPSGLCCVPLAF